MTRSIYLAPWRIDVDIRDGIRAPNSSAALARAVAAALDTVRAPAPASIGLILSDDAELSSLNATHMGKPGPTDVLSFPLLPPEAFAPGATAPDVPRPPGSRLHLGDIIVSVERAIEQAEQGRGGQTGDVRWSPADELRLLVTHGTLHLCGHDHADPDDERDMRVLERRVLGLVAEGAGGRCVAAKSVAEVSRRCDARAPVVGLRRPFGDDEEDRGPVLAPTFPRE